MRNLMPVLLGTLISMGMSGQIIQIGQDIYGEMPGDKFGQSVSVNADGSHIVGSSIFAMQNGMQVGSVRVFEIVNGNWEQKGNTLFGEVQTAFGYSTELSLDGSILGISSPSDNTNGNNSGALELFELQGNIWIPLGQKLFGENQGDVFGDLELSADGSILVVGIPGDDTSAGNAGKVATYTYQGTEWVQMANSILGNPEFNSFGQGIDLSLDGTKLAVHNGSDERILIYHFEDSEWIQKGDAILAEEDDIFFGTAQISDDGLRVAGTAIGRNSNDQQVVVARVFEFDGVNWNQLGETINDGPPTNQRTDFQIDLSGDGTILAVGSPGLTDVGSTAPGIVTLYSMVSDNWEVLGARIEGETEQGYFGFALGLSNNGDTLVVGALRDDTNGASAGSVRAFGIPVLGIEDQTPKISISIYPNPASDYLRIWSNNLPIDHVQVFSLDGKLVKDLKMKSASNLVLLRTHDLSFGQYMIVISSDKQTSVKKFLKQ